MNELAGRRVVITRALDQADALAELLEAAGAIAVTMPLIEIVAESAGAAALATADPAAFDWLVVTSPNGAEQYVTAHGSVTADSVAAVGSATAAAFSAVGIACTLVPRVQSAVGLLGEFPAGTGRVLLVQAHGAAATLAAGLAQLGWQVTAIAPYRAVPTLPTARQQLTALSADAVLFASGSAVRAWAAVFGDSTPPIVVAIGPQTAQAAADAGLKVAVVAADHSLPGLVAALRRHLDGGQ